MPSSDSVVVRWPDAGPHPGHSGPLGTAMLGEMVIDVAFLGANGISRERGLTTPDPAVAAVKQEAVRRSRRRVLVGVHTKFGVSSFCRFADLADFEAVVTGTELSAAEARKYEAMGPRVIRA